MYKKGMMLFYKKSIFYFLMAGTIMMIFVMFLTGKPLNTPNTPSGILNLEFAYSHQKVKQVLTSWENLSTQENNIIGAAKKNTWFDFIFLFFYSSFLFICCKKIALALQQDQRIAQCLNFFSTLALIVGLLDIFENIGMLISLAHKGSDIVALITTTISIIKWLLVASVILSIIFGLLIKVIYKRK